MEGDHPLIRALLLSALLLTDAALAHPRHVSEAQVEWSPDGRSLDVALRVIPEDLETALSQLADSPVVLDGSEATLRLAERYLRKHFRLLDGERSAPLSLLGMAFERRDLWLYFSCLQPRVSGLRLRHTVLMDVVASQHNHLRRLWAPRAASLLFTAQEPERKLPVYVEDVP